MTPQERSTACQAFAKTLQDRPLDPAIPLDEKIYIRTLHVHHQGSLTIDPVQRLATQIGRMAGSCVWLFTGNIGSGKSTELRRLRQELKAGNCVVFLIDASDYINLNQKIEISDFLISLTAAFAEQAGELLGEDQIESGYWERLGNFLTRTEIGGSEASIGADIPLKINLKAAIRQDPTVKNRIQQQLRGHLVSLKDDLEAYRAEIITRIRNKNGPDTKIVLLLDSLERLRGTGEADDDVFSSVKAMFSQYADMLRLSDMQVVYSVAPYLIKLAPHLNAIFGAGALCHLATAHVFKSRSRDVDSECGMKVIRQIVTARYRAWNQLISESTLDTLIEQSGGDLRDLFRMLSIVLLELEFSSDEPAVLRYALDQVRRDMTWVTDGQLERLKYIAQHKSARLRDEADRDALVHDLETKRVLMYRNGEDWYDVHPLLRSLVDAA